MSDISSSNKTPSQISAQQALKILSDGGVLEKGTRISDHLAIATAKKVELPEDLTIDSLYIGKKTQISSLPSGLKAKKIHLEAQSLERLGSGISCEILKINNCPIQNIPEDLTVKFKIDLYECNNLEELPDNLHLQDVELNICKCRKINKLPIDMQGIKTLSISECEKLTHLPGNMKLKSFIMNKQKIKTIGSGISCDVLCLANAEIQGLPDDLTVKIKLDLQGCRKLIKLPDNLKTGSLNLNQCVSLENLPNGLDVVFLDLQGCALLKALPDDLRLRGGRLNVRDCTRLQKLPDNLGEVAELDISGCLNVTQLPKGLNVTSWIDFAGSSVTSLPEGYEDVGFRWRGVSVPRKVIFSPETLTPDEILNESNAEVRRVMMERFGYEKLFERVNAEELDKDIDAGGERRLLKIAIENDEDLVCVAVQCPSTGHKFVLRVPPNITSCKQAVAWTAGYNNPDQYNPVVET